MRSRSKPAGATVVPGWCRPPAWALALLACLLLVLAVLKAYGLQPALSDENIYFYMASRVAEGRLPYGHFSFAHPPVHLLLAVPVALLGGGFTAFKLLPVLSVLLATVALWLAGRGPGGTRAGEATGLATAALFALSYDVLRASSHFTGATEACAFLAAALSALCLHRPRLAGVLVGLAAGTALYVLPSGLALLAVLALQDRGAGRRAAGAFLATVAAWNLLGLLLGGMAFLDDVYLYHVDKVERPGALGAALVMVAFHQTPLALGLLPAAVAWSWSPARPRWRETLQGHAGLVLVASLGGVAACVAFLAVQPRVYHFYLLPALTLGAPVAAWAVVESARSVASQRWSLAGGLAVAWLAVGGAHVALYRSLPYAARTWGQASRYGWVDAPLPTWVNQVVRAVAWQDERVIGHEYPGVTYALWHESRLYDAADAVARDVARITTPGQSITGDSLAAPLAALVAGRRMAADIADTNTERFQSGRLSLDRFLRDVKADDLGAVVVFPGKRLASMPGVRTWLREGFQLVSSYPSQEAGTVQVWRPIPAPPVADP
jgi:hypothetical protein